MSATLTYSGRLVTTACWCGIQYAIPEELDNYQARQFNDGREQRSIYCPLGHTHVRAGTGEAKRLQSELEKEQNRLKRERERAGRLAAERDQAQASARGYKGAATRARRRAGAGVCPCCKRTFKQLANHMKSKHPGFDPADVEAKA